jgi:predicted RNA-binding protein YlqC (UPF0109 family)
MLDNSKSDPLVLELLKKQDQVDVEEQIMNHKIKLGINVTQEDLENKTAKEMNMYLAIA